MADELIDGGQQGGQEVPQQSAAQAGTPAGTPAQPSQPQEPAQGTPHPGDLQQTPAAAPATPPGPAAAPAAGGAATPEQQAQWQSAREYARAMGFDPGQAQDDASFLQGLFNQARQAQQAQQQALAYQRALMLQGQQQAPPAPPPAKKPGFWNPPEWNQSWDSLLTKDEKGNVALLPGAPPEILGKHLAYQQYRRDFADRLLTNPAETLKPLVAEQAQEIAQQIAREQLSRYQDQSHVQSFLAQNSNWLHQRDGQGQLLRDQLTGQPLLSAAGTRFRDYVVEAERSGIRDIRSQENYAKRMLQGDLAMEQLRAGQARQQQQAANQQVVQQNRHLPNQSGSLPRPGVPAQQPPQNESLSLRDQLSQALAQAGMTDAAFA